MKNYLKKMIGVLLTLAMIISVFPNVAYAENKTIYDNATVLSSTGAVTGALSSDDDSNLYKYTVDVTGHFNFTLTNLSKDDVYWDVEISTMDENLDTVENEGKSVTSNTYNFKEGTVIYLKVSKASNDMDGEKYSLKVNATSASNWEQEPHNTIQDATVITPQEELHGNLYSDDDVDYYRYTVDVTGYYNFTLTNHSKEDVEWNMEISTMSEDLVTNDNEGKSVTSNTYNFEKGTDIYIKISKASNFMQGKEYSLKVNATPASDWEQEPNNTIEDATVITPQAELYGNLYSDDDVDYYQYTVDVTGYYNFTLTNQSGEDVQWGLSVGTKSEVFEDGGNEHNSYTTHTYNFAKGTIIYLKVSKFSNFMQGKEYSLKVNATPASDWEQEPNDSFGTKDILENSKLEYGNLYSEDDADYYKYIATKTGTTKINFTYDGNNVGYGWEVTVYDSSRKKIKTVSEITTDKTIKIKTKKGKNYFIVVRSEEDTVVNITYALEIK